VVSYEEAAAANDGKHLQRVVALLKHAAKSGLI